MKNTLNKIIFCTLHFALCTIFLTSCEKTLIPGNIHDSVAEPTISSFEPTTGEPGTVITIKGTNLSTVNQALIGEQATQILYRYSNEEIVLKTTGNEATGKIKLVNHKGVAESPSDFTVIDIIPTVTSIAPNPTEWLAYTEHTINGSNLNGVFEAKIGDYKVNITDKNTDKLVFNIPYFEATEALDLKLYYKQAGVTLFIVAAAGIPVNNPVIEPVINDFPAQAFPETQLVLTGEYLDRITEVIYLDEDLTITSQKPTELKVLLPAIPTGQEYLEGSLEIVHNGGIHTEITSNFVISTGTVLNFVYHPNITLSVRSYESALGYANYNNFFNCTTGEIYSACDYASIKDNIDLFFSISGGNIQLNNPASSDQQLKNFKCEGIGNLPTERGVNATRYYILKDTSAAESALKTKILAGELEEIKTTMLDTLLGFSASCLQPNSSNPRWRDFDASTESNATYWSVGDVLVFRHFDNAPSGTGGDGGKIGFMQIVDVYLSGTVAGTSPPENSIYRSTVTINVWCQKQPE
ncbi:hypothetical protein FACS1894180_0390 [Bacteroidia bacterium]|nr:hypothetical protein FACS1894178_4220 [Bacteroidia bacterium]GHV42879.1 hypothetical protein FACS1894180_0390 [Bacteroidia bacterium]